MVVVWVILRAYHRISKIPDKCPVVQLQLRRGDVHDLQDLKLHDGEMDTNSDILHHPGVKIKIFCLHPMKSPHVNLLTRQTLL